MDKLANQKKVFAIIAVLLLLSAVVLITVIPTMLQNISSTSTPLKAAIGVLIGIALHLVVAYWFGIRLRKRSSMVRNEAYILMAVGFFFLGLMMLDGAYASLDDVRFFAIGMFICASLDFAASLVSVLALIFLRAKKKK